MDKKNWDKLDKRFTEILNSITEEEVQTFLSQFPKVPHGWVDIKEHLPQVYAVDYIKKGYSIFKVKDINGKIMKTRVCDGMVWFHVFAEPKRITHWWNPNR